MQFPNVRAQALSRTVAVPPRTLRGQDTSPLHGWTTPVPKTSSSGAESRPGKLADFQTIVLNGSNLDREPVRASNSRRPVIGLVIGIWEYQYPRDLALKMNELYRRQPALRLKKEIGDTIGNPTHGASSLSPFNDHHRILTQFLPGYRRQRPQYHSGDGRQTLASKIKTPAPLGGGAVTLPCKNERIDVGFRRRKRFRNYLPKLTTSIDDSLVKDSHSPAKLLQDGQLECTSYFHEFEENSILHKQFPESRIDGKTTYLRHGRHIYPAMTCSEFAPFALVAFIIAYTLAPDFSSPAISALYIDGLDAMPLCDADVAGMTSSG
ncbi:hypothetical protein EDD18DRAFT_1111679 [Armillaria luteobubalina]|uniref:Uncharacterized protein n=1 Tax=Armillaria luteobubalina TaxID=153913 RepID=A0AA39PID4_9AGAR|nr:hypothetical protein EDD18DRAFT_1111679 [Armillaria luteobubalina]